MLDDNDPAYNNALQSLMTAFNLAAPTGKEQAAFAAEINEAQEDGQSRRAVLRYATGRLYDGLAYGNWPGM